MTPAARSPAWQASHGAAWLAAALQGLKPVLPDAIAQHLPPTSLNLKGTACVASSA
jgi:hypothetical protein